MEERNRDGVVKDIKLYSVCDRLATNDDSLESCFRLAARYDVQVMIHRGDTYAKHAKARQALPLLVDDVAVDYPDVRFVISHLGKHSADFERYMLAKVNEMIPYMGDPGRQHMYDSD